MGNSCKKPRCEKAKRDTAAAGWWWWWPLGSALFSEKWVVRAPFSEAGKEQENGNVIGGTGPQEGRWAGSRGRQQPVPSERDTLLWRHEAEEQGTVRTVDVLVQSCGSSISFPGEGRDKAVF